MNLTKIVLAMALMGGVATVNAQTPPTCPPGGTSCTISNQHQGDIDNRSSANNSQSNASQANPSSNSNQSGNTMSGTYDNRAQTTQNATNTTTGTISSTTSSAATGNRSSNDNKSSSNSGGNTLGNTMAGSGNSEQGQNQQAQGGASTATGGVADARNSGGNSSTTVDTSDRSSTSYSSQALFIPTVQVAPPNIVAGSNIVVDRGSCGPLMAVESTPLNGVYFSMFGQRSVPLGTTDRLVAYHGGTFRADGNRLIGHRPVSYIAVIGVAGSRSIGLGGGKTGGDWGNGGASGGSSMQRMVVQTTLEPCEYAVQAPVLIETAPKRIRE